MIGKEGLELIKRFEGFTGREYLCPAGVRTIGYGHVVRDGESWPEGITPEAAETLLLDDVSDAEGFVIDAVVVPLSPHQFDALVSFVFNIGGRAFGGSTLLGKLNAGDYDGAAEEFRRWKYINEQVSRGLVRRRAAEEKLFRSAP